MIVAIRYFESFPVLKNEIYAVSLTYSNKFKEELHLKTIRKTKAELHHLQFMFQKQNRLYHNMFGDVHNNISLKKCRCSISHN